MACSGKCRRARTEGDDSGTVRKKHTVRRVARSIVVRAIAASVITAIVRRVAARRRAAADSARTAQDERAASHAGVAEWPSLVDDAARTVVTDADARPWVEPVDGQCPLSHPVKGNKSSNIYHEPSSRFYDMTIPERCYRDAAAAEADGMRAPKR